MIVGWKVTLQYGYSYIAFVFDSVTMAVDFVTYAMVHYNKEESGDNRELFVSMKPILEMEEQKGEEE